MPLHATGCRRAARIGPGSQEGREMSSRVRLTEQRVALLKPRARAYNILDSQVDGLLVRVQPTGHCSYMMRARFPGGSQPVRRLVGHVGKMGLERAREVVREWWEHIRL